MIIGTCRNYTNWKPIKEGEWGECLYAHQRVYVKFPDSLKVPLGVSELWSRPNFGCVEFIRVKFVQASSGE